MRTALSERFAGGLARSLLKDFDPAQPRDFHGRWSSTGRGAPTPSDVRGAVVEERKAPSEAWASIMSKLQDLRAETGLKVNLAKGADPRAEVVVQKTVSLLPIGLQSAIKQIGVKIEIVTDETQAKDSFQVGGQEFKEAGSVNYAKNTMVLWEDSLRRSVVAHECGHVAVKALCAVVARGMDRDAALHDEWNKIFSKKEAIDEKFNASHGRWAVRGDDPEWDRLDDREKEIDAERDKIWLLSNALDRFNEATMEEGGVTSYSDSYVKDKEIGTNKNTWAYGGRLESVEYREGAKKREKYDRESARLIREKDALDKEWMKRRDDYKAKHGREADPGDDPEMDRIRGEWQKRWNDLKSLGTPPPFVRPIAFITQAANENFAEIAEVMSRDEADREAFLAKVRSSHPKTVHAFAVMWALFGRDFKVPKVVG